MVTQSLKPKSGEWLLQTAAASVLGRLVIQLGKILGFKTINIVRNPQQVDELKEIGADAVIVSSKEDVQKRILELTEGKGVLYALDPVGGDTTSAILKSLAYGGKLVIYGQLSDQDIHFPSGLLVVKLLTLSGFWLVDWFKNSSPEEIKKNFTELMTLFATGKINCPVSNEFSLDEFHLAIEKALSEGKGGKVLLKI